MFEKYDTNKNINEHNLCFNLNCTYVAGDNNELESSALDWRVNVFAGESLRELNVTSNNTTRRQSSNGPRTAPSRPRRYIPPAIDKPVK